MKKKLTGLLIAAAVLSVLTVGVSRASAFFTTYAEAVGGRTIYLGDIPFIEENFDSWKKEVRIGNDPDSAQAVYVRALAFAGDQYELTYEGTGWTLDPTDGYYYYDVPVLPGELTNELVVAIRDTTTESGIPAVEAGNQFNVVVIYETTPAIQNGTDSAGNILYEEADWTREVTTKTTGGD